MADTWAINVMAKAVQAVASADALLKVGDPDGASDRAFFGVFNAARAVLVLEGLPLGKSDAETLEIFGRYLVETGRATVHTTACSTASRPFAIRPTKQSKALSPMSRPKRCGMPVPSLMKCRPGSCPHSITRARTLVHNELTIETQDARDPALIGAHGDAGRNLSGQAGVASRVHATRACFAPQLSQRLRREYLERPGRDRAAGKNAYLHPGVDPNAHSDQTAPRCQTGIASAST